MTSPNPSRAIAAARAIDSKKGVDIRVLDVSGTLGVTDFFVIATGTSLRHVRTLAEEVVEVIRQQFGDRVHHCEGMDDARWVLLDYDDMVVHVFQEEPRIYYSLERLWSDSIPVDWRRSGDLAGDLQEATGD